MDNFIKNFSNTYKVDVEALKLLKDKVELKKYQKKEIFIREGDFQENFYFLVSGVARAYKTTEKNKEFTRSLFTAPETITSLKAVTQGTRSELTYSCLTDCDFFVGKVKDFYDLIKTNIELSNMYSRLLEKAFFQMENRVFELSLKAKEKHQLLKKRIPNIDDLIPQYQIASYLNITNVQLSRIRKQNKLEQL